MDRTEVYSKLYGILRTKANTKDMSFQLNSYFDGTSVISIIMVKKDASVRLSMVVIPQENGYRVVSRSDVVECDTISEVSNLLSRIITRTRLTFSKL